MESFVEAIDNIYNLYSKEPYVNVEEEILLSAVLLSMESNGIRDEYMRKVNIDSLLKAGETKAYDYFKKAIINICWKDEKILLKIYEYAVSKRGKDKEKYSIYYTPYWIVKYMVDSSIKKATLNYHRLNDIKILEPACGCGAFLLYIFDVLFELYSKTGEYTPESICKYIIEDNLYGIDIDSESIQMCKYLLTIKMFKKTGRLFSFKYNLFIRDFLKQSLVDDYSFNLIIGNPPYFENRNINKYYDKNFLKINYTTAVGRFDIYSLFIEKSILLLQEKGILSFVVPGNLLSNNNFSGTRKYILDNSNISNIINLGEDIFQSVSMNMIILTLNKGKFSKHNRIVCKNISHSENKKRDIRTKDFKLIPQEFYYSTLLNVFDIDSSYAVFKLREKIYKSNPLKIEDVSEVVAGIATGNIREKLLTKDNSRVNAKKILRGKDVLRYYHQWSGLYFIDDKSLIDRKAGEYATFMRPDMINKEKIIIRQTADRFICSYDNEGYYILNTLYSLTLKNKEKIELKYLLALLNSKLYNFLYSSLIREQGKLFPQLKIFHIQNSPVNIPSKSIQEEIINIVNKIISLNEELKNQKTVDKEHKKKTKDSLSLLLDDMIFKIFCLTKEEIEIINNEQN